jgi:hypothetical protein
MHAHIHVLNCDLSSITKGITTESRNQEGSKVERSIVAAARKLMKAIYTMLKEGRKSLQAGWLKTTQSS